MGYEVYVHHPESLKRRAEDFAAWSLWAPQHAPWTGVSISDMASLLQAVCFTEDPSEQAACQVLDAGGILQSAEVRVIFSRAGSAMNDKVREVFHRALEDGYPVRVVFSKGFGSKLASEYLAKQASA
jgi:hypothetical protein